MLAVCTLGTVILNVTDASDAFGRRLATFEYPALGGAEHEDLGRKPTQVTLSAKIWGDTYKADFSALLTVFNAGERVRFTHPHHGSLMVRIESLTDRTSAEAVDLVDVDLTLIEDNLSEVSFTSDAGSVAAAANAFDSSASAAASAISALP